MSSIETISVSSFMTRDVKTEKEDQNVLTACRTMHENNIGSVIIVNKDDKNNTKPVGIITERDVVRLLGSLNPSLLQTPLRDIISKPLITISINSSIKDAIQTMQQKNIRRLVIADKEKMVGIITDKDIFRAIMNNQDLIPCLLSDKLLVEHKTVYDQFGQNWFSDPFAEAISKQRGSSISMSDPKLTKPWHGIPREQIEWHPIVDKDACIGCGTCVTGCSRLVYRYDYDGKNAVVADPLNCLVGCVTCSNTCPTHAISFPPLDTITSLLSQTNVHHDIEDDLIARKDKLQFVDSLPHPDRIANLVVDKILRTPSDKILIVNLVPKTEDDFFCQFMPGQYIEVWIPDTQWISRAYSIGNSPRGDGSIELQIRKADGGRFTTYAFENMKIGDTLKVRGPLGTFTIKSTIDTPLLFVAGSTGFAPIKSMIEQQLTLSSNRRIILIWGAHTFSEFYEFELIDKWLKTNPNFTCIFAARNINAQDRSLIPDKSWLVQESLNNVIQEESKLDLSICDGYVAGPPSMMPAIIKNFEF